MAFPTDNLKNPLAIARFAGTCILGLALDLWTKAWAFKSLATSIMTDPVTGRVTVISDQYQFLPGWLHFEVTANQGAVFGLGQGQVKFFVAVSIFAIFLLTWLFSTSGRRWFPQIVLGMLLAGVLGNMWDRTTIGYVRDMIHALPERNWPGTTQPIFPWIFNIADVMLCCGVGLTLILGLFHNKERIEPTPGQSEAPARIKGNPAPDRR
jgi:lipoprotein signal peptidase